MSRIFHKGYFSEIFRQLKTAGIVSTGVLLLANILSLFSKINTVIMPSMPSAVQMAFIYKPFIYITGFLFTFIAFGWMNKRSQSDFYHAVPVKRTQMYFSTVFAVLAWMFMGIVSHWCLRAILNLLAGIPYNYLLDLCVLVNMLIACIEVVGAVSLACAISGTRFVNFVAAVVILFMPRLLMTVLAAFIDSNQGCGLVVGSMSIFFDPSYNIIASPFCDMYSLFGESSSFMTISYTKIPAMIYSFVCSIVLVLLGWRAFLKRKSEYAGIPTTNKIFQRIISICVGLPLLLILDALILSGEIGAVVVTGMILITISFVVFCLYNLISTKSGKKTVAAMPWFLVCIAIALVFVLATKLIISHEEKVKIEAENVKSFSVEGNSEFDFFLGIYGKDYRDLIFSKTEFDDEQAIRILTASLNRSGPARDGLTVRFHRRHGGDIVRNVSVSDVDLDRLNELFLTNERYAEAQVEFPIGRNYYSAGALDRHDSLKVAESFKEEYESLSDADKKMLEVNETIGWYSNDNPELLIYGCKGVDNYIANYSINSFVPRTLKLYLELINEKQGKNALAALKSIEEWTKNGGYISFYINIGGNELPAFTMDEWELNYAKEWMETDDGIGDQNSRLPTETDQEYCELISILARGTLTNDPTSYIFVNVNKYGSDKFILSDDYINAMAAIALSPEDAARAEELISIINPKYFEDMEDPEIDYDFDF